MPADQYLNKNYNYKSPPFSSRIRADIPSKGSIFIQPSMFVFTCDVFNGPKVHGKKCDNNNKVDNEAITEPATE